MSEAGIVKEAGAAELSHWTGAVGLSGSGGFFVSVTVWISAFVVALTRRAETHGIWPVSPTAIGAAVVLASPWSPARA